MNKSLLIFFAVIAAASALRLPVDLKAAIGKIELVRQKNAGYESEAMADAVPEIAYESEQMADAVPEVPQPEVVEAPRPPIALMKDVVVEKVENLRPKVEEYENVAMADTVPEVAYESESMADVVPEVAYESEEMADQVPEVAQHIRLPIAFKDIAVKIENLLPKSEGYKFADMADGIQEEAVQDEAQAYESEHMADPVYESKDMSDELYETAQMKDEYENQSMADEISEEKESDEVVALVMADVGPEPRRFGADGADEINAITNGVVAAIRRFAADNGIELNRRFSADGGVESNRFSADGSDN